MVSYLITNIKYITRVCAHKIGPTNWVSAWANQVFLGLTIPVGLGGQIPEWRERAGGRRGGGGGVVEVAAEVVGGLGAWGLVAD